MQQTMLVLFAAAFFHGARGQMTPVSKAIDLLLDLEAKITSDAEASKKAYAAKDAACKDESQDLGYAITTSSSDVADAEARIAKGTSDIDALTAAIAGMSADISENEATLGEATKDRENETAVFSDEEKELGEIIDTLRRAVAILTREMQQGGSLAQGLAAKPVLQALESLVQGAVLSTADAARLSALIQSDRAEEETDDSALGAPDAAAYEGHSGDIIETLEDLEDKAQVQLADLRKNEADSAHSFAMMQQSLETEIMVTKGNLAAAKEDLEVVAKGKEAATGDQSEASEALAQSKATLKTLAQNCEEAKEDFEAESASREEELTAMAGAVAALRTIGGAETLSYGLGQASFLQRSRVSSDSDLAGLEVTRVVRELANKQGTPELARLAFRVAAVMQLGGSAGADPFAKVKGLVSDLITKLEKDADAEATAKERCDKDLAKANAEQEDKTSEVEKFTTKIGRWSATSAKLQVEITALEESLTKLKATQATMDTNRLNESSLYKQQTADMQAGVQGVKLALTTLREYFAKPEQQHDAAQEAASGIIGLLEVVESDFITNLAKLEVDEASSQSEYESTSQANKLEKVAKEQDVAYKTQEKARLDKAVADASSDREEEQQELDAVNEYLAAKEKECADKPMAYEERKKRREDEIAGLKEALSIIESETALVQRRSNRARRSLRLRSSSG